MEAGCRERNRERIQREPLRAPLWRPGGEHGQWERDVPEDLPALVSILYRLSPLPHGVHGANCNRRDREIAEQNQARRAAPTGPPAEGPWPPPPTPPPSPAVVRSERALYTRPHLPHHESFKVLGQMRTQAHRCRLLGELLRGNNALMHSALLHGRGAGWWSRWPHSRAAEQPPLHAACAAC